MYNTRKFNSRYTQHAVVSHVRMDWTPVILALLFVATMIVIIATIA